MSKQPQLPDGSTGFYNKHNERVVTGSQMGRRDSDLEREKGDDPFPWFVHLQRMKMSPCGAYDNGGAYWGVGDRRIGWMYIAFNDDRYPAIPEIRLFVRAIDRRSAMMELHNRYHGKLKFHNDESRPDASHHSSARAKHGSGQD